MNNDTSKQNGFTLIEILIAIAITGIVSTVLMTSFQSQQKSYVIQEGVAAMQQNLRAGIEIMKQEIRMAGYDRQNIGGMGILDISPR
ncbi:MAG: prepilin-type N-terminal cleavage/methylation domain-containing protein, partial [Thermodesulfobacteriota bacterium]